MQILNAIVPPVVPNILSYLQTMVMQIFIYHGRENRIAMENICIPILSEEQDNYNTANNVKNEDKIVINILSRKPFVIEGIKNYCTNNDPGKGYDVFSYCNNKCTTLSNLLHCTDCILSEVSYNQESDPTDKKMKTNIFLIDDFNFIEVRSTQHGRDDNYECLNLLNDFIHCLKKADKRIGGKVKAIIITENYNPLYLKKLTGLKADGLVHFTSRKEEILEAIESAVKGKFYVDIKINRLISIYEKSLIRDLLTRLTKRQLETLLEISNGLKNRQIAAKFCVTVDAVEKHKTNIEHLLRIKTAEELMSFAVKSRDDIQYLLKYPNRKNNK